MKDIPSLAGIYELFTKDPDALKFIFDSAHPHTEELPQGWAQKLDSFEKMVVLKAIRMDKVLPAIEDWVTEKLGK